MIEEYEFSVIKGFGVASGTAENSPYPKGTIELQSPFFKSKGLDLTAFYLGTINAQFLCSKIELIKWDVEFNNIQWCQDFPPESFRFARCKIFHLTDSYQGLIYQPTKETKIGHFQQKNVLEILAEPIKRLEYQSKAKLLINSNYLLFE